MAAPYVVDFNPVAVSIGPLAVHWYGLMYLLGFAAAFFLARSRCSRPSSPIAKEQVEDLIFYCAIGVIAGGRLGYVLFYNFPKFLDNPLWLFYINEGGMSFHGGLLGVIFAMWLFARKLNRGFFEISDFVAPLVPIGLGAGRIGNFIGGELWGRTTDVPWAMVFPKADALARHPSQLYQFFLEGLLLFTILWLYSAKPRDTMKVSGLFLLFYGLFRIITEFVREPDAHLQFIALGWVTMGQLLSLPMIAIGVLFFMMGHKGMGGRKHAAVP